MKLLKRLFLILIVLVCAFTFVGCKNDSDSNEKPEDVIIEVSEGLFEGVNVLKVTENLNFPQEVKGVKLTYTSDNEAVISNTGVVTRQENDVLVTVKVELEYQGVKDSFEVKFKVLKAEKQPDEPGDEPEAPADAVKVEAVLNGNVGDTYKVQGTVAAVNAQSFILSDETGMILVYKGKTWTCDVAKGDIVVVTGASASYAKAVQFGNSCEYEKVGKAEFKDGKAQVLDAALIDAMGDEEVATIKLVKVKGTLQVSGNYFNVNFEGSKYTGSVTYPADAEGLKAYDGKEVEITGYYTGISSSKYFNILYTEIKGEGEEQPGENEFELPEGTVEVTCEEANSLGLALEADATSETVYAVTGVITKISNDMYGNMYINDGTAEFLVYGVYDKDGNRFDAMTSKPEVGDTITVYGKIYNYKGTTPEIKNSTLAGFSKGSGTVNPGEIEQNTKETALTVTEAIAIAKQYGDAGTGIQLYVKGTVVKITNPQYGEMYITDGVNELYVYGATGMDGTYFNLLEDKPLAGDDVILLGALKTYNGEAEMDRSKIVEFKHNEIVFDESEYAVSTIANAREAEAGTKLKVTGVVAIVTYANGYIPNGFYLVDETGSIYIYGDQVAYRVKAGNKVTICGEKTYYVLGTEQANAEKFGYKGCCQLQNPFMTENDEKEDNEFSTEGITENTVKEIIDTPVTENITTKIYKVTALVKKVPGKGFVNYYINDLDDATGSYTYTSCNGGDFEWLDEFDGKICTVYLAAHNCKATATECFYRFIPVKVVYEGFTFDLKDAPEFGVKYYGLDQFNSLYKADPSLKVVTNVSSSLLNFENVELSYTSSDENVVYFTLEGTDLVMHTKDSGTAVITVKGVLGLDSYEQTVEITVEKPADVTSITVKQAIEAEDNTVVTVKGVVAASLVNRTGFYLIDETGLISVVFENGSDFKEIKLGNMVVVEGTRIHNKKETSTGLAGQTVINNAKIVVNYYGEHEYSNVSFDSSKTIADLAAYKVDTDYSTKVYKLKAKIDIAESSFYANMYLQDLNDSSKSIRLYSSDAKKQYDWLYGLKGQEVELEIALCNWNDKKEYTACVISAVIDGVKVVNDLNFR